MTVRNTLSRIRDKLGIESTQGVLIWAERNGLLADLSIEPERET